MRFFLLLTTFGGLLALVKAQIGQVYNPIQDFCRRFSHQAAVIGNRLYIDGGELNTVDRRASNFTNTRLLFHDLSTDRRGDEDIGMPPLVNNLTKGAEVPSVIGGYLWPDIANAKMYLYGGEYPDGEPADFALWMYDVYGDNWTRIPADNGIQRLSFGAGTTVESSGRGYYLGGWMSSRSVFGWAGPRRASSRMLIYDMIQNTWLNETGPEDGVGRAEGVMMYIPAGDSGMLIHFGGVRVPGGAESEEEAAPMNEIDVYDLASRRWYTQNSTGEVPELRRRFCAGAATAQDSSSYNIYLYGGLGFPPNETGYDDIYILSIPSFRWIRGFPTIPRNDSEANPHYDLTCNVINGAQMLIIGGIFPRDMSSRVCDSPGTAGVHNLDMGKDNPNQVFWSRFVPNRTTYNVPLDVLEVIGGDPTGGARVTRPENGFGHSDLAVLFGRQASVESRDPTRLPPNPIGQPSSSASPTPGPNLGVIIGPAIGGAAVVVGAIVFYFCYRRRRNIKNSTNSPATVSGHMYPQSLQPQSLHPVPMPSYANTYPSPPTSPAPAYPSYPAMQPMTAEYQHYNQPIYHRDANAPPSELENNSLQRVLSPAELPHAASPPPKACYDPPREPSVSGDTSSADNRRPPPITTNFTFYKDHNNSTG